MCSVNKELSRRIGMEIEYEETVWGRRYSEEICPRTEDALEAALYIETNAVKHGLVKHYRKWPGLCSAHLRKLGGSKEFEFVHYTEKKKELRRARREKREPNRDAFITKHDLKISPIPGLSRVAPGRTMDDLVEERNQQLNAARGEKPYLGINKVMRQSRLATPKEVSKSPKPYFYCKCAETLKACKSLFREWHEQYIEASADLRKGNLEAIFPPFSIKPVVFSPI